MHYGKINNKPHKLECTCKSCEYTWTIRGVDNMHELRVRLNK